MTRFANRLVIVLSDPVSSYGYLGDELGRDLNPENVFREVVLLSPCESGERNQFGLTIIGASEREFAEKLERINPDVVRAYGGHWPARLVCSNKTRAPVIVSLHDKTSAFMHPSIRYADMVLCVSNIVKMKAIERGVDPSRVRMINNRVDLEVFQPKRITGANIERFNDFPTGKHVLFVGRLAKEKNLDTLIKSFAHLPADYSLICIGVGNRADYDRLAGEFSVADRCFYIGQVQQNELPYWYSWCDCMCTPSRWEGFGLVFIEAAACGAAIITSDIAPMNEYLTHDVNACLVKDYENPEALAAAMRRVCEDRAYRERLAAAAPEVAEPFDRHKIDEIEAQAYREALGMQTRPAPPYWRIFGWEAETILRGRLRRYTPRRILAALLRRAGLGKATR